MSLLTKIYLERCMAVMCNCAECGGGDLYQPCDNKLLKIQGDIARFKRRQIWLTVLAFVLVGLGLGITL